MAAVAPPPAPAPAPVPAPAPATVPVADQTTDLLQKLSLDSQPKPADATQPAAATAKKQGAAASQPLSVAIPPEPSITPVIQDFTDPNLFYLPAYYYGGYDSSMSEWDDYPRYLNSDGVEIAPKCWNGQIACYYCLFSAHHRAVFSPIDHLRPSVQDFRVDPELPLAADQRATAEQGQQEPLWGQHCRNKHDEKDVYNRRGKGGPEE